MKLFVNRFKKYFIYGIFSFFALPIFFWWCSKVHADLLEDMTKPAIDKRIMINPWTKSQVWRKTIKGKNSAIVRISRFLLVLTIALSVTMILYNGMVYIIETWQGKEWKSLAKNVILIIVWIFIALFSSVIITLIQSIPENTLETETGGGYTVDQSVIK